MKSLGNEPDDAQALTESEARYRNLINSMIEPWVLLAAVRAESGKVVDFAFADANPAALAVYGMSRAELLGRSLIELHPASRTTDLFDMYVAVVDHDTPMILDDWSYPQDIYEGAVLKYDVRAVRVGDAVSQTWRDVSQRYLATTKLAASEARLRATLDAMLDPHVVLTAARDAGGAIVDFVCSDANDAAAEFNHRSREDLIGATLLGQQPSTGAPSLFEDCVHVVETGEPLVLDNWSLPPDSPGGQIRYFDVRAVKFSDGLLQTWRDVTERFEATAQLAASEERYRLLADNISDVLIRSSDGLMRWVSPSLTSALGWDPSDWTGHAFEDFTHPDDTQTVQQAWAVVAGGAGISIRLRMRNTQGAYHWVETHAAPFINAQGEQDGIVATFRVVDPEVAAYQELEHLARSDSLTGLLNRQEILHKLNGISSTTRTPGDRTAVLFCDIDRFKDINDVRGHAAGDEVLRTLAERTRAAVRDADYVARIGGDELLIILTGVHTLQDATAVAEKIRGAASVPISADGALVSTTLSIGVTLVRPGESVDTLVARADKAMYVAKSQGRNQVVALDEADERATEHE